MLDFLGWTTLFFGLSAAVFQLLGFTYNDYATKRGKSKIQEIKNKLGELTIFEVEKHYFIRLNNILQVFRKSKIILIKFLILMFLLNTVIIPLSSLFVEYLKLEQFDKAWNELMSYKMYTSILIWKSILMHILAGLFGMSLNWISIKITLYLISKMAASRNRLVLLKHVFIDCLVVLFFCLFLLPITVTVNWQLADENNEWITFFDAWNGTYDDTPIDYLIVLLYGSTSSIPTIIYLSTAIFLIQFKLIPNKIRSFLIDILNAMIPPDRNMFKDLSTAFVVIGGLFGALKFLFN